LTTLYGNEFQTVGAATEKARMANTIRVRGTANLGAWLDLSDREGTCGTSNYYQVLLLTLRWCYRWTILFTENVPGNINLVFLSSFETENFSCSSVAFWTKKCVH